MAFPDGGGVPTPKSYLTAATTNATLVRAGATAVRGIFAVNTTGSAMYLKLYDRATAPTAGAGTPVLRVPIPAGGFVASDASFAFLLGVGFTVTGAIADADATAVATGCAVNIGISS